MFPVDSDMLSQYPDEIFTRWTLQHLKFVSSPHATGWLFLSHLRAISCVRTLLRKVFPLWSRNLLSRLSPLCRELTLFTRTSKRTRSTVVSRPRDFLDDEFPRTWRENHFSGRILSLTLPISFNELATSMLETKELQKCRIMLLGVLYKL